MKFISQVIVFFLAMSAPALGYTPDFGASPRFKPGHPLTGEAIQDAVRDTGELEKIEDTAKILIKYPQAKIAIRGHTGFTECSGMTCMELSVLRAQLVYRYLLSRGVPVNQIRSVEGLGSNRFLIPKGADGLDSQNFRVDYEAIF